MADDEPQESGDNETVTPPCGRSTGPTLFHALAHPRRRALIALLAVAPAQPVSLRTAAHLIAVLEDGPAVASNQVTNVRTSLKRSHLPPLVTTGVIARPDHHILPGPTYAAALRALAVLAGANPAPLRPVPSDR